MNTYANTPDQVQLTRAVKDLRSMLEENSFVGIPDWISANFQ